MLRLIAACAAIAAVAIPASAQVTSQSECQKDYFGVVRCQTQSNQQANPYSAIRTPNVAEDTANSFNRGMEVGARIRALREQQEADERRQESAMAQADAARAQEAVSDAVAADIEQQKHYGREAAKLVAAGNCAGAESYALSVGSIGLAKTVRDYCAPVGK